MKQYFLWLLPFFSSVMHAALQPEFFTFPLQQSRTVRFIHEDTHQQMRKVLSCPDLGKLKTDVIQKDQSSTTIVLTGQNKISKGNIKVDNSIQVKGIEFKPQLNVTVKLECVIL